jgi:Inner membrane component of T3SS, cytoplasmic domain
MTATPITEVDPTTACRAFDGPVEQLRIWGSHTTYPLPRPPVEHWTIGAAKTCEIRLDDQARCVSRLHAQLLRKDGQWVLRDLDSKNGVWLDGARCSEATIEPGAEIRIGRITLIAENDRTVALRRFLSRLLGWSQGAITDVDRALKSIRLATTRRVPIALMGDGDLVCIALAIHRWVLGPDRPFVVSDPRRRRVAATVRSAANCDTGMLAATEAAGGSVCLQSRRLPPDFQQLVAAVREPQASVRLVFCLQRAEDVEPFLLAPIAIPPLSQRAHELDRIIDEYTRDAFMDFGVPPAAIAAADHQWVRRAASTSLPEIEKATRRLAALRAFGSVSKAAANLGMATNSLTRWLERRQTTAELERTAAPAPGGAST